MSVAEHPSGRAGRILLALAAIWLVLAIFPLTRDVTLIKVAGYQALVLAAAILLWRQHRRGTPVRWHAPLTIAAGVLAGALLIAIPFATNPGHALMEWSRLAGGLLAFFVAMQVFQTQRHLVPLTAAVTAALTLASAYGLAQWFGWDPFPWGAVTSQELDLLRRAPATYGNPNLAAHAIVLGIPLALLLTAWGQWWAIACLPILAAHLALNGTRGAAAGLAVAVVMVGAAWLSTRTRAAADNAGSVATPVLSGMAAPVLLAVVAVLAVSGMTQQRLGTPVPQDTTLTLRFHSTHGAAEMIRDRPVLGHGPGHFVIENAPYWTAHEQRRYADIGRRNTRVHNEPLDLAVQGGVAAGAAYLALLVLAIGLGIANGFTGDDPKRRRMSLAFAAVFAAFLVDGLFGFNLHAPVSGGLFWLLLGAFAGGLATPATGSAQRLAGKSAWLSPALAAGCLVLSAMAFASSFFALRGDGALHHNEPEAARASYAAAARLHPWDWRVQQALGGLMLEQTYYGNAIGHFREALALHPNDPATLAGLGRSLAYYASFLEGEGMEGFENAEDEGLEIAARAAALVPDFTPAALVRALITANRAGRAQGTPDAHAAAAAAGEAAEELLRLDTGSPRQAWQLLANARAASGEHSGTIEAFAAALAHGPAIERTWQAFDTYANATGAYGGYLDSIRWREERLRLDTPGAAEERAAMAMRRAGAIASGYDSPGQVRVALDEAARHEPLHPGLWPLYYALAGQYASERAAFRASVEEAGRRLEDSPSSEALPVRVAGLAVQGGEALPAAVENCYQAIAFELGQERPLDELRARYGWVWSFLRDEAEHQPVDDETQGLIGLRLGMAAALLGDDERAMATFEAAAPRLPTEPRIEVFRQIAASAMRLGRPDAAREAMGSAARLAPANLGIQLEHARTLAAIGDRDTARAAYRRILGSFQFDRENRARLEAEMAQLGEGE